MGVAEIAFRGRQEASKLLDRALRRGARGRAGSALRRQSPCCSMPSARAAGPLLRRRGRATRTPRPPPPAHAGGARPRRRRPRSGLRWPLRPARVPRARRSAIPSTGTSIRSPGRRAPLVHWSRLDPLDAAHGRRQQGRLGAEPPPVAGARSARPTALTGDERYAAGVRRATCATGCDANPPGLGHQLGEQPGGGAAPRSPGAGRSCCFRGVARARPELLRRHARRSIRAHAAHVERYLSHYFSPNTHLTGEALGLFYAGRGLPGAARGAPLARARGAASSSSESERQVLADGVYFEQSTCYQRYTVEIYLHFLVLAARNGCACPAAIARARAAACSTSCCACASPTAACPQIGDADGGWLLPLAAARAGRPARRLRGRGGALRPRRLRVGGRRARRPRSLWLLGRPAWPPSTRSRPRPAGAAVAAVRRRRLRRDARRLGPRRPPADLRRRPARLPGQRRPRPRRPAERPVRRLRRAVPRGPGHLRLHRGSDVARLLPRHGRPQHGHGRRREPGRARGPVLLAGAARARGCAAGSPRRPSISRTPSTTPIARLPDPVRHRRRVLFVKPRYWVVVDDLDGGAAHRVELRFQFAPVDGRRSMPGEWSRAGRRRPWPPPALPSRPAFQRSTSARDGGSHRGLGVPDYGQRQAGAGRSSTRDGGAAAARLDAAVARSRTQTRRRPPCRSLSGDGRPPGPRFDGPARSRGASTERGDVHVERRRNDACAASPGS